MFREMEGLFCLPTVVIKASEPSEEPLTSPPIVNSHPTTPPSISEECIRFSIADELAQNVEIAARPFGMEAHRFLVGWYNEQVAPQFHLPYDENTLAFLVISIPSMFEKAFLPFVKSGFRLPGEDPSEPEIRSESSSDEEDEDVPKPPPQSMDPVDRCCSSVLRKIASSLPYPTEVIADFEMVNRRPRILVQTMGHVSGAAHFYQRKHLKEDPFDTSEAALGKKRFLGVSIHPLYGGWFAFRGAIIMKNVVCPELPLKPCVDVVPDEQSRAWLLKEFNHNWKEWKYRDVIPVCARYSDKQREYFATLPSDRQKLLEGYRTEVDDAVASSTSEEESSFSEGSDSLSDQI